MTPSLATITGPASPVVTTAEAKVHLGITDSAQDTYIAAIVSAATNRVQNESGMRLFTQTVELRADGFPVKSNNMSLQVAPLAAITSIKYDDSNDSEQTLAATAYWPDLLSVPARITIKDQWPTTKEGKPASVRIRMVAGKDDVADIPQHVKHAILLLTSHWFINREETSELSLKTIPNGVRDILWSDSNYYFLVL